MGGRQIHAVTGAFGYSGRYIARNLLDRGIDVRTLTNASPTSDPFEGKVRAYPLAFDRPEKIAEALEGVSVLYNTYWVRFNYKWFTHAMAVQNTLTLFRVAKQAGVERIVHLSITNPSEDSPLEYFRCKAILEKALRELDVSHAILRPAVLFGGEGEGAGKNKERDDRAPQRDFHIPTKGRSADRAPNGARRALGGFLVR